MKIKCFKVKNVDSNYDQHNNFCNKIIGSKEKGNYHKEKLPAQLA